MGSRYLLTGVQLGLLMSPYMENKEKLSLLNEIMDKQHSFNSDFAVISDCKLVGNVYHEHIKKK